LLEVAEFTVGFVFDNAGIAFDLGFVKRLRQECLSSVVREDSGRNA
jgi:hypothetical protein